MENAVDTENRAKQLETAYLKLFEVQEDSVKHIEGASHRAFEKFSVYQPIKLTYSAGVH